MAGRQNVFRVLELGHGKSPLTFWLPQRHPDKRIEYTGVDHLATPTSRQPPKNLSLNFHTMKIGDFLESEELAPSEHYDEVHLHMLSSKPHLHEYLKQIQRVLKPGGIAYALEETHPDRATMQMEFPGGFATARYPFFTTNFVEMISRKGQLKAAKINATLAKKLRRAGFEIMRVTLFDAKTPAGEKAEIPLGVQKLAGKRLPSRSAAAFIKRISDFGHMSGQFIILRKK